MMVKGLNWDISQKIKKNTKMPLQLLKKSHELGESAFLGRNLSPRILLLASLCTKTLSTRCWNNYETQELIFYWEYHISYKLRNTDQEQVKKHVYLLELLVTNKA